MHHRNSGHSHRSKRNNVFPKSVCKFLLLDSVWRSATKVTNLSLKIEQKTQQIASGSYSLHSNILFGTLIHTSIVDFGRMNKSEHWNYSYMLSLFLSSFSPRKILLFTQYLRWERIRRELLQPSLVFSLIECLLIKFSDWRPLIFLYHISFAWLGTNRHLRLFYCHSLEYCRLHSRSHSYRLTGRVSWYCWDCHRNLVSGMLLSVMLRWDSVRTGESSFLNFI